MSTGWWRAWALVSKPNSESRSRLSLFGLWTALTYKPGCFSSYFPSPHNSSGRNCIHCKKDRPISCFSFQRFCKPWLSLGRTNLMRVMRTMFGFRALCSSLSLPSSSSSDFTIASQGGQGLVGMMPPFLCHLYVLAHIHAFPLLS